MSVSTDHQTVMKEAVALHRDGRLDQAMVLYRQVLDARPDDADLLRLIGTAACQAGRLADGVNFLEKSLARQPDQPDVSHNLGHALQSLGRFDEAIARYDRALALKPDYASAWFSRGNALMQLDRLGGAVASFDRAVAVRSDFAEAWLHRGNALMDMDRLPEALASYERALRIVPDFVEALINQSDVLMNLARPAEAAASYDRVLKAQPDLAYAWSNRGNALAGLKRFDEALVSYDRAIQLDADLADAHSNRGNVLDRLGRPEEAIDSCNRALELRPDFAKAFNLRGNAEMSLGRYEEALASYDQALGLQPDYPEALSNRGGVLMKLARHAEALLSCDQALAILPDVAETHNNRGSALLGLQRFDEALVAFNKALSLAPDVAEVHSNRGNALQGLSRFGEAVASYNQALGVDGGYAEAYKNRGNALQKLDLVEEAIASYERAMALKPDYPWVAGHLLHNQMQIADWTGLHARIEQLAARMRAGEKGATPFLLHALMDAPDLHRAAAVAFTAEKYLPRPDRPDLEKYPPHERIRIAYVSADFGEHPVTYLLAGMLERHDRSRFEVFAVSLKKAEDAGEAYWRQRVVAAVDTFIDVSDKTDIEAAAMLRDLEIDIAVDLNGYTKDCRTDIFAERAAPIQVNYIGFLGTMGTDYIDYLIADPIIIPPEARNDYAEKIAYLPTFQMNDDRQGDSGKTFSRQELGLPADAFVFCCFNMVYKITPDVFDVWMRILKRLPQSVLWLYAKSEAAARNLRAEAQKRGVAPERLVFAARMPLPDHMARQKAADLFLDTHPYNAGATASNALKMGLPVLTRVGTSYAARMGASLLTAVGLPEFIVETPQAYEDLAVALANDPVQMAAIRRKLSADLPSSPLFDTTRATRDIESVFVAMYERYRNDLPPDHIDLSVQTRPA